MRITREIVTAELNKFIENIFYLPEVISVKVRKVILQKGEERAQKLQEMMDKSYHDCYSDVDLAVLVQLHPQDTVTPELYRKRIDRFGITEENCLGLDYVEENQMYRMILKNGMRYDFKIEIELNQNAERLNMPPKKERYSNPGWPIEKVNSFWFVQVQALGKLYRRDYLIGDHLANMNVNETLVQQMVLRDLEYGTNHHRYGYEEELAYLKNMGKCPFGVGKADFYRIADKLYAAALTYDELTSVFYPESKEKSSKFFEIWKCYDKGGNTYDLH